MTRFRQGRLIAAIALPAVAIVVAGWLLLFEKHAQPKRPLTSLVPAVRAINGLGFDLLGKVSEPNENALYSPYSIQIALAMTYAGAAGETRDEMRKILHYSQDDAALHDAFASMSKTLDGLAEPTSNDSKVGKRPVTISVANRLFAQCGSPFRHAFLDFLEATYHSSLAQVNFTEAEATRQAINSWVADRTRQRIRELVNALDPDDTRLVLVNAIYLRAAWETPFIKASTIPSSFAVRGQTPADVPTMLVTTALGYGRSGDLEALTIPYSVPDLQLLIILPKPMVALASVEASLTADQLGALGQVPVRRVRLHMPKFGIEMPTQDLKAVLERLGMKLAFDQSRADFSGISEKGSLYISKILHKTFLRIDEEGCEASAAAAVVMDQVVSGVSGLGDPIEVHVDRPFLFAIQHRPSGGLLFLGRVVDPR